MAQLERGLTAAAEHLPPRLRAATALSLMGLLAATGMCGGNAAPSRGLGGSRQRPLHVTTLTLSTGRRLPSDGRPPTPCFSPSAGRVSRTPWVVAPFAPWSRGGARAPSRVGSAPASIYWYIRTNPEFLRPARAVSEALPTVRPCVRWRQRWKLIA